MDAYGTGTARGSWALLQATRCASPILDYKNGKYLKGGRWVAADRLLYQTGIELEAAREKVATAAAAASQAAVEAELDTGGFPVGTRVFAKGLAPSGQREWFVAQVIGHRNRAPPLSIKYLATHPDGETNPLALPIPLQAFVYTSDVQTDVP